MAMAEARHCRALDQQVRLAGGPQENRKPPEIRASLGTEADSDRGIAMNRSGHNTDRDRTADFSERWWPSPFGEDDEQGMLNHITDAKRREALALVREGRLYDLGHILDERAPVFPGRYFRQTLVTTAHQINADPGVRPPTGLGDNKVNWITVVVAGTMQEGTHIDGLNHLQIGDRGYNGWTVAALAGPSGYQAARCRDDPADRDPRLAG